jgi:hypothetical protein
MRSSMSFCAATRRRRDLGPRYARMPVDVSTLLPFTNMRARCPECGARYPIRVHFDRGCRLATGEHFHRICPRGHEWLEQTSENPT